ncbi:src-like-adapter 2 [Passer montanus]|uniref:src-like-adapter 2 n=1 Tax=Passer montanus TaxID=9160 RepID=UPI00195F82A2|nr:src-like-adapter 2 [Passer montanus]
MSQPFPITYIVLKVLMVWGWYSSHKAHGEKEQGPGQPSQVPFALCLPGCCCLSVHCGKCSASASVTHCHIHRLGNGCLYMSSWLTFPSLHKLVGPYSGNALAALQHPEQCVGRCPVGCGLPFYYSCEPFLLSSSSLQFSETTSPPEDSPISQSLREAISFCLILSETDTPEPDPTGKVVVVDKLCNS